jgi:hypothetical protein
MEFTKESPLILGQPFLSTAGHKSMLGLEKSASTLMARKRSLSFGPDIKKNAK